MSLRSRHSRRLASLLSAESKVYVRVSYRKQPKRYCVFWTRGPSPDEMRQLAARHGAAVFELNLDDLDWLRE